jgi:hypothetical protein
MDPRLGQRALVTAIETGDDEIARILVEGGVDVNCTPGRRRSSPRSRPATSR